MRLKAALLAACLSVLPLLARGQTPGTFLTNRPIATTGSVNNINTALGLKADATNPVVTGTLGVSGAATIGGVVAAAGLQAGAATFGGTLGPAGTISIGNLVITSNWNSSGFAGMHLNNRLIADRPATAFNDFSDWDLRRTTTFTGGTSANINALLRVTDTIGANDATQNWALTATNTTSGTAGGAAVGGFFQATRAAGASDKIFASISDAIDLNVGASSANGAQVVGAEFDVESFRADDGSNGQSFGGVGLRKGINVVAIRHASSDAVQNVVSHGLWFTTNVLPLGSVSDSLTNYQSVIGVGVNVQAQSILDTRGAIAPAGSSNPVAAVTMSAGHVVDFNGGAALNSAPGDYLAWDAGASKLKFYVAGVAKWSVDTSGNVRSAGTNTASTTP